MGVNMVRETGGEGDSHSLGGLGCGSGNTPFEYPGLYQLSDEFSGVRQRRYKCLLAANLLLVSAASLFGAISAAFCAFAWVSAVLIAASVVIWVAFDRSPSYGDWFDARAMAESVKTASWRYAMRVQPYDLLLSQDEVASLFESEMREISEQSERVACRLDYSKCSECQMGATPAMKETRMLDWRIRKEIYLDGRVRDQKNWYAFKAGKNSRHKTAWFFAVIVMQVLAVVLAVLSAAGTCVDLTGLVLTAISSSLAWLQMQQQTALAHSYGVAAKELALVESKFTRAEDEEAFVRLVEQAELAMSREHTLWVSRNAY